MRFDLITVFPDFFSGPLDYGIVRRARQAALIETHIHDLRNFTRDRHRTVDDRPFGGGEGMVLKPEPLFAAVESLLGGEGAPAPPRAAIVLLSAAGKLFRQESARRFAELDRMVVICGRYEGVDERVAEHLVSDEISVGDFVLCGGELPAAMIIDAVTRLIPGALGNQDSAVNESFSEAMVTRAELGGGTEVENSSQRHSLLVPILDCPHYTRPPSFRGWNVPEVLLSGNHEAIRRWRREKALEKTLRNRPELLNAVTGRGE